MFSFFSSLLYEPKMIKSFTLSQNPYIRFGISDECKTCEVIQLCEDPKLYTLQYMKKIEKGVLFIFENDIRLRIYQEDKHILYHLFSVNHNISYFHIFTQDEIELGKYFRFRNHNHDIYDYELDHFFDYIENHD